MVSFSDLKAVNFLNKRRVAVSIAQLQVQFELAQQLHTATHCRLYINKHLLYSYLQK